MRERIMSARYWIEPSLQVYADDGQTAMDWQEDNAALDAWLASLTVGQFDGILNFLMDQIYAPPAAFDRPVA